MSCVLGASVRSGWAELVAVSSRDGRPILLDRRRIGLVGEGLPDNPYHHEGLRLPLAESVALVARVRRSVTAMATAALEEAQDRFGATAIVFEASPYDRLPDDVAEVLASYALTCAADAMMYRETVADCARALGMDVVRYPRKTDVIELAAGEIGSDVGRVVRELGAAVGPPWTKEHRQAAAAAILVLFRRGELRR
jgi:hypothetical protein